LQPRRKSGASRLGRSGRKPGGFRYFKEALHCHVGAGPGSATPLSCGWESNMLERLAVGKKGIRPSGLVPEVNAPIERSPAGLYRRVVLTVTAPLNVAVR